MTSLLSPQPEPAGRPGQAAGWRGEDGAAGAGQPGQGLHHRPQLSGRLQTHREGESDYFRKTIKLPKYFILLLEKDHEITSGCIRNCMSSVCLYVGWYVSQFSIQYIYGRCKL